MKFIIQLDEICIYRDNLKWFLIDPKSILMHYNLLEEQTIIWSKLYRAERNVDLIGLPSNTFTSAVVLLQATSYTPQTFLGSTVIMFDNPQKKSHNYRFLEDYIYPDILLMAVTIVGSRGALRFNKTTRTWPIRNFLRLASIRVARRFRCGIFRVAISNIVAIEKFPTH